MRNFWSVISVLTLIGEVCCFPTSPCDLCPAGTFLEHACSTGVDIQCLPCQEGIYSASASHQKQCSPCSECPEGMYVDKPCQAVTDTNCAPCSNIPSVKSDSFLASCELGDAEGAKPHHEPEMLADAPENAEASANQDGHADHVEPEGGDKNMAGKENVPDQENTDLETNHNDAVNTEEHNKEIHENASPLPDSSAKNIEPHFDLADTPMNSIGKLDMNEADADKDHQNPESELNEKGNLKPLQVLEQGSEDTAAFTTLSTQEISSLDEARLGAVKLSHDEEESNSKREMNDEFNQTIFVPHYGKSRTSDSDVGDDQMNKTDGNVYEGTQADAPVEDTVDHVHVDTLSDNITDHHAENSNDTGGVLHSVKADSSHVPVEDPEGRKRAAIILGVAIGGMTLFALVFFASRFLRRTKQRKFKDMRKVSFDQDSDEIHPLSYTATGSHEDPDAEEKHGLYRQGPPVGPSSPRKNPPKLEPSQPSEVQIVPEKSVTVPILTVSPAQDDPPPQEDLSESLSDHGMINS